MTVKSISRSQDGRAASSFSTLSSVHPVHLSMFSWKPFLLHSPWVKGLTYPVLTLHSLLAYVPLKHS